MPRLNRVLASAAAALIAAISLSTAASAGLTDVSAPEAVPPKLDATRRLLENARERYGALRGYQARYEKDEIDTGGRLRKERSFLKFDKPFAIYMIWSEGERKGTQLLYAQDHFDDKMIVQLPGLIFNFIGPVTVATDDPRVQKDQKHSIKKAGIGFFLEDLWGDFERLNPRGGIRVRDVKEGVDVEGDRGTLVDLELLDPSENYPHKAVVFSDATGLPTEIRLFKSGPEPVETYRYLDVVPNPPANDPAFQKIANPALFKKYAEATTPASPKA